MKEKQIEEMAKILSRVCMEGGCSECPYHELRHKEYTCLDLNMASTLYNAGYRKTADVAREIFEEIEKSIKSLEYKATYPHSHIPFETMTEVVNWVLHEIVPSKIAELKKKYTENKGE